jgi:PIN domain nuclease of toxin-antitoxin system
MNVLLDTCTFLWLTREPHMISELAREVLDDPTTILNMSHASVLEMVVKHRAGKLTFPQPPEKWIPSRRAYFQIKDLPLDELLIYRSGKLPDVHRDPFDRLIAAHAMQSGCTVISPDTQLGLLGASRLW